ncbi:MAG: hypothetical protein A4E20_10750 [Nitrospira sp. SG-bin2]|uniref:hypothetical protein n=1 Tax=Nitrospira cf. moscoviensis SBR1015 TaxID=96242 RepID=UPI000A0BCDF2|nr:hypothetical protein [Nitrospira cf. moscoviensis SBR1015]OQW34490.1 MAG: hypothetical protein A4E20_10750 [Nitrospira sp. SG-bin2]
MTYEGPTETAFSNGFEYDEWADLWCYRCVKDDMESVFCPILNGVILNNEVPKEWSPGTDDLRDRYHCSEFEAE